MARTLDYDIVIIGAGPAGLTAGLYAGRGMLKAVVLERGAPGGELLNTEKIEDYPGFESVDGWELAQKFESHARKFGAEIVTGVTAVALRRLPDGTFETVTEGGDVYRSPVGDPHLGRHAGEARRPRRARVRGEGGVVLRGVRRRLLQGTHDRGGRRRRRGVRGGGLSHALRGEGLPRSTAATSSAPRRSSRSALFENPKIEVIWNTVVDRDRRRRATGSCTSCTCATRSPGSSATLPATGIFVFVGFKPNTGILQEHVEHDASGYLVTDTNMASSLPGLFVAGDVRAQLTRQVTTAAGDATTATIAAEKYLDARGATTSGRPRAK